ncbi:hypothetical protein EWX78_08915 [Campylobacter coli]|uniref:Uncharacterized protein n=1 Tax=Campylobacter coli TaxID=195 RepID=A0A644SAS7_CAMCO|nr:hypothetical protein [Campylobacter coli]EAI3824142.1 hypothetical protein [Campylobacter coli]EAJ2630390.1 hypothetical protein [Campylobacter coli]EAJ9198244.1 hypothetical protein [Campylobacter coli]EAJ9411629.1 hypothetical protein [Campylobacter coli]
MVILVFKILAIIVSFASMYAMLCYMLELGIFFMFLAISLSLMSALIEDYGLEHIINLFYSTIEWIWDIGKYVLIIFAIMAVLAVVLKLVNNFQSNKIANKRIDIKNKEEQSCKILIIDNNMENLFALEKEKLYEK